VSNVTAIFRQGRLGCKCGSHKSRWSWYSWLSWLSIDDVLNLWTTSACSSPHLRRRISESIFIAACSMHDYDEDRTEQRYIWRRTCARCIGVARWLSGRASDLRSKSRGFDCSPHRFFNSMQFNNSRLVAHGFLCHCSLCSVLHDGIMFCIFALSAQSSVSLVPNIFLSLRKNTERVVSMKFAGGNHYHNRLNDYIWAKLEEEQGNRIREKIRIDVNQFLRDVKQVLTPSEWIHKSLHRRRQMRS